MRVTLKGVFTDQCTEIYVCQLETTQRFSPQRCSFVCWWTVQPWRCAVLFMREKGRIEQLGHRLAQRPVAPYAKTRINPPNLSSHSIVCLPHLISKYYWPSSFDIMGWLSRVLTFFSLTLLSWAEILAPLCFCCPAVEPTRVHIPAGLRLQHF